MLRRNVCQNTVFETNCNETTVGLFKFIICCCINVRLVGACNVLILLFQCKVNVNVCQCVFHWIMTTRYRCRAGELEWPDFAIEA